MNNKYQEIISFFTRIEERGIMPMTDVEYDHSLLVSSFLNDDLTPTVGSSSLSFGEFKSRALDLLSIYDESSFHDFLSSIPIVCKEDDSILRFNTTIMTSQNSASFYPVEKFDCPKNQFHLSPYYLAHEFHHALKDSSKNEYVYMLRYADVIPQFFELIAGTNVDDQKALIKNRFAFLQESKKMLSQKNNREHSNLLLNTIDSKNCQYLNCFYYSVLLYELFQDSPKLVLSQIQRVLKKEITTYDLLKEFGLFQKNFDFEVEKGIQYLKKYSS